jgi:predicted CXXCH cytochrome family protein
MTSSRKSWLVVLVVAIVALAFAVPAYATGGTSGHIAWSTLGGANGTSPHGGYSTTTQKCLVCHAVHNAPGGSEVLLRSSVADACLYCHVDNAIATQVYNSNNTNYNTADYNNAHNTWSVGAVTLGVTCTQCHQVHAAASMMTSNTYLTQKILKVADNTSAGFDPDAGPPLASDTSNTAISKWCTSCHYVALGTAYPYYNTAYNGQTHIMTTATANYVAAGGAGTVSARVAWINSNECSSCHNSGYTTNAWPHYTAGVRFLVSGANASATPAAATNSQADGVCLRCHRNGTGTSGVGLGY